MKRLLLLLPLLMLSCQQLGLFSDYGQVQWVPIKETLPDSYTFYLTTNIQRYKVIKEGKQLTITIAGEFFTTPRELPREKQRLKGWEFTRTLPEGDATIEQLIARAWRAGECKIEYEMRIEAVSVCMRLDVGKQEYYWDMIQEPVQKKLAGTYVKLNEYLYNLFPEARQYPTLFPFSDTPPPHTKGDSWDVRLWD